MATLRENGNGPSNGSHVLNNTSMGMDIDVVKKIPGGEGMPGSEAFRGRRLLTDTIDYLARVDPQRIFAAIPVSDHLFDGFQDVNMSMIAAAVNHTARWLDNHLGPIAPRNSVISYIGPADLRFAIFFFASIKCRRKLLLISPRNTETQNAALMRMASCIALLYADELKLTARKIEAVAPSLHTCQVPTLSEILIASPKAKPFMLNATFEEIKDNPCLILHSSGTTGNPKLVYMTHGTFSVTDNDTTMPVPQGRRPQNGSQFNFTTPGRYYSCFPPYHMAGVQAYSILPVFSKTATVIMGPPRTPPSGFLVAEIMNMQEIRALWLPPFIIEQWASEPKAMEQARDLDFILFGGDTLAPSVGNRLSEVTDVCQMYGSLEMGQVQMLIPLPGQWEYLEPNPYEECDMQPMHDGLFEMVLHKQPKLKNRRSLAHNFPDMKIWRTGDLFVPHPWKAGLWRFHSRLHDMVVLSTGHKLRPLEMETLIQGDVMIAGALIVGNGKPDPLLLIEPARSVNMQKSVFINNIWPTVSQANAIAPSYGQISRSKIIISRPDTPFVRAPKGTIIRKLTEARYRDEIDRACAQDDSLHDDGEIGALERILINSTKQFIRNVLNQLCPDMQLDDSDDFIAMGLSSLNASELGRKLRFGISRRTPNNMTMISLRMIYLNPSISGLAKSIITTMFQSAGQSNTAENQDTDTMRQYVSESTAGLPPPNPERIVPPPSGGMNVVVVGSQGQIGPQVVRSLLDDKSVASVRCLDKGENGRERFKEMTEEQGVKCDTNDPRLRFYAADLSRQNLGLSDAQASEALNDALVIVHNSWNVHFGWSLESYKDEMIKSVRNVVDISAKSKYNPRIVFVSSVLSVQEWKLISPGTDVTEEPVQSYNVSSSLGYGQSKHVAERILAVAAEKSHIPVTILRVGQVAGPTTRSAKGNWASNNWISSLARISKSLNLIPTGLSEIDWIPVDKMGEIMYDVMMYDMMSDMASRYQLKNSDTFEEDERKRRLRVYNLVNPNVTKFSDFVDVLRRRIGQKATEVPFSEWVQKVAAAAPESMPEAEATAVVKVFAFFEYLATTASSGTEYKPKFCTERIKAASNTMAEKLPAIDQHLIELWCDEWGI